CRARWRRRITNRAKSWAFRSAARSPRPHEDGAGALQPTIMNMNQTLLVELLTEELPPKALARLGAAFAAGVENGLRARGFLEADAQLTAYATPRRLALTLSGVRPTSPDKTVRE